MTLRPTTNPIRTYPRGNPNRDPSILRKHQIPRNRRSNQNPHQRQRRSDSSTRIRQKPDGRPTKEPIHTIQERTISLARHSKSENEIPHKDGPETRRTIQNLRSLGTPHIQTRSSKNLEDPQCLPRSTPHAIHRNRSPWPQLPPTPT